MFLARNFKNIFAILTVMLMTACASNPPAPVIDRQPNDQSSQEAQVPASTEQAADEVLHKGIYVVKEDDTLYSIGRKFGISYREIAAANDIPIPYSIHVGQPLTIPSIASIDARRTVEEEATTVPFGTEEAPTVIESLSTEELHEFTPVINTPKVFREPYSDGAYNRETPVIVIDKSINPPTTLTEDNPETPTIPALQKPKASTNPIDLAYENITWAWPHAGKVLSHFGNNDSKGLDISGKVGQAVNAAANGKVIYIGSDLRGYGRMVIIKHNALFLSVYAHNSHIFVKEGDTVSLGQKIAELGSTETDRPKLHFEIRKQGKSINPEEYLPVK